MGLDLLHGVVVVNVLAAVGAFVEFEIGDRVGLAFITAAPISSNPLDPLAAAGGASSDFDEGFSHALYGSLCDVK